MKRLLICLLAVLLAASAVGPAALAETQPDWLIGDPTMDGVVNAQDAMWVLHESSLKKDSIFIYSYAFPRDNVDYDPYEFYYIAGCLLVSDVNGDNLTNAADALLILQYAVGKRTAFPRTALADLHERFPSLDSDITFSWPGDR